MIVHVYTQQCVLLYLGGWKTVYSYFLGTITLGKKKYTYLSVGISVQWGKYTNLKIQINFNHLFGHIDPSGATHPLICKQMFFYNLTVHKVTVPT